MRTASIWRTKMKKAITIYVDDCVESIEEVNATFVLHKPTGATSVHMFNLNLKDMDTLYLPWKGDAVVKKEGDTDD